MDPFKAGQNLGKAILGDADDTYQKEVRQIAQGETAIQQARRARSQALIDAARVDARKAVTADLLARANAGDLGAQAELGASVLGSNTTMSLGQLGEYQQPRFGEVSNIRADALGLGEDPVDIPLANRAGAYLSGKDYQPIRAEGGAYVADGATLGDLDVVPTPSTLSMIESREATTRRADARAERAAMPKPSTAKPERFTAPSQGSLRSAFGKGKGELDQPRYNLFLRWRQENPDIVNGEQALQTFLTGHDVFAINETGNFRPNPNRYRPAEDDGIPVVDSGRTLGEVVSGPVVDASGREVKPYTQAQYDARLTDARQKLVEARQAIAAGANREAVKARMRKLGYTKTADLL